MEAPDSQQAVINNQYPINSSNSPKGTTMKTKLLMLTAVMSCAFAGQAMALTKEEYKAQGDRISADYKAGRDKCGTLKDNAKDICVAEAKGAEKIAKAELEAQYKPSPRNDEKLLSPRATPPMTSPRKSATT
jgi:hypothetical protein